MNRYRVEGSEHYAYLIDNITHICWSEGLPFHTIQPIADDMNRVNKARAEGCKLNCSTLSCHQCWHNGMGRLSQAIREVTQ